MGQGDRVVRGRWLLALTGLVAGLLAFAVGEGIYDLIPAESGQISTMGKIVRGPTAETSTVAETRNAALAFGSLGFFLAGGLGVAGGMARQSRSALFIAGATGAVVGAATAAGISLAILPPTLKIQPDFQDYELLISAGVKGAIWGLTGAVAGLAFALGLGEPRMLFRGATAGFVGAALATIAFELIGAAVFPLASTDQPISTSWPSRLLARLLVAVGTATFVTLTLQYDRAGGYNPAPASCR